MKLKIYFFFVAMFTATIVKADPTSLIVQLDPVVYTPGNNGGHPRSPILIPEFTQDGYTLTAGSYTAGSIVVLKDADGNVVFTSYVYVEGDTIILPATLSGTYTIEVTRGDITFVGEIEL